MIFNKRYLPSSKKNKRTWKLITFNRKYIFIHGCLLVVSEFAMFKNGITWNPPPTRMPVRKYECFILLKHLYGRLVGNMKSFLTGCKLKLGDVFIHRLLKCPEMFGCFPLI